MSLTQINDYGIGNINLTSMMMSMDLQRRDKQAISLTHYDDALEPKIAAGSIVELGGALFKCEADESITGWAGIGNDNDVYIKLVPSGTTATAAFVTAAPTWSTSKQGWYVGNDRYIAWLRKDSAGNYRYKHLLPEKQQATIYFEEIIEIGDWDMSEATGTAIISVAHELTREKIRSLDIMIIKDVALTLYSLVGNYDIVLHNYGGGSLDYISATHIFMKRTTGGLFDNTNFDATGFNRGWITIKHKA